MLDRALQGLVSPEQAEAVAAYVDAASRKSDRERSDLAKDKSGVFTGALRRCRARGVICRVPMRLCGVVCGCGHDPCVQLRRRCVCSFLAAAPVCSQCHCCCPDRLAAGRPDSQPCPALHAGAFATNPATGQPIPIWVADYVLGGYGSGAIMAVPGHDSRDFEFAQKFGLPVTRVVAPADAAAAAAGGSSGGDGSGAAGASSSSSGAEAASSSSSNGDGLPYCEAGVAVASSSGSSGLDINGLPTAEAKDTVCVWCPVLCVLLQAVLHVSCCLL